MNVDIRTELEEAFDWDEEEVQKALEFTQGFIESLHKNSISESSAFSILKSELLKKYQFYQVDPLIKYFFRGALSYKEPIES